MLSAVWAFMNMAAYSASNADATTAGITFDMTSMAPLRAGEAE